MARATAAVQMRKAGVGGRLLLALVFVLVDVDIAHI